MDLALVGRGTTLDTSEAGCKSCGSFGGEDDWEFDASIIVLSPWTFCSSEEDDVSSCGEWIWLWEWWSSEFL